MPRFQKIEHIVVDGNVSKQCSKCKETKSLSEFGKRKTAADGKDYICKFCASIPRSKKVNRQKKCEYQKRYRERNKEKVKKYNREYNKSINGKINKNKYKQNRKAKKKNGVRTLTTTEWNDNLKKFNHSCAYCGTKSEYLHQEHIIPLSKGGWYTKQNIIPACKSCNSRKNNKELNEWYKEQEFFDSKRLDKIHRHMNLKENILQLALC